MSSVEDGHREQPRIIALLRQASELGQATLFSRLEEVIGPSELRPGHFQLLRFPGPEGLRPTELARRLGTSKQAINPLLNDLERWGYIERRLDPGDRRGRVLCLTASGVTLLGTIRRLHAEIEAEWEHALGPSRFRTLRAALRELTAAHPDNASADAHARQDADQRPRADA